MLFQSGINGIIISERLFAADEAVGAGGDAFGAVEGADEIVDVGETALEAHFADRVVFIGQQLPGEADAFAGDVFQGGEAELFFKPFEKNIAAQAAFAAKGVDWYFFGEVFVNVLQHKVQAATVAVRGALFGQRLQLLALDDADQQFLEAEVCVDIF